MNLQVIFDDTTAVPSGLRALVGVDHFGDLVFQRRSRLEAMRAVAAAADATLLALRTNEDRRELMTKLREVADDRLFLFCPSHLVPLGGAEALATLLKQLQYSPSALRIPLRGARDKRGWTLVRTPLLRALLAKLQENDLDGFFGQHGDAFAEVRDRLHLIDVSDERTLLDFLSGQFDARHFNAIEHDEYTVLKRSKDRAKLKREYDFYRLVPPQIQMFLVQPFDFQDDGQTASYRMERLSVPDMALQWLHGAFQPHEFDRFLNHLFHFIAIRPERTVPRAEAAQIQDALYGDKVRTRVEALKQMPAFRELAPLLERACGGVDELTERYLDLYGRFRGRLPSRVVISHGDPCFSNILYSKTNQYLKLIDPRGAEDERGLYIDPYYDVAKISHSILGGYDFINQDKFELRVDEKLRLQLSLEGSPPAWAAEKFHAKLQQAGFDAELTRLCEASLFISMLPLHMDRPRKVLAFAVNAALILETLTGKRGKGA